MRSFGNFLVSVLVSAHTINDLDLCLELDLRLRLRVLNIRTINT